ncbi:MAG: FAD-binding protein [Lacisediminihabitans sp.]
MTSISRRHVIVLGAVGLLAAGCAPVQSPIPTPTRPPRQTQSGFADWDALASALTGTLTMPGDESYDTVRLVENPRYDDARPIAVLTAASAADVAAGVTYAVQHSVPLALRSGGHSYTGWSSGGATGTDMSPSLVIDTRGMSEVTLNDDNSVHIQAGASLATVYTVLGNASRAIAAGSCATVGATGLVLGGGVGVLVRAFGLTCDSLTEVEIVTADGKLRTVSKTREPKLFWACQGGGGGHLGVVTALSLSTHPAPEVTSFSLNWPFSEAATVVKAWQTWAPEADPKLWSTLKLLAGTRHPDGPGLYLSGTWIGAKSQLGAQLAPFLATVGVEPSHNGSSTSSYLDAMMGYAGCADIPLPQCQTGADGKLTRESSAATSHVPRIPLNSAGIATLIAQVAAASTVPDLKEGGVSMDALGGAVRTLAPSATAFPHRTSIMTVQYTATFPNGADPAPFDDYVRGFRAALVPEWGDSAYVNYADASLADPATSYFGSNVARLSMVRGEYDPNGLFSQPQGY